MTEDIKQIGQRLKGLRDVLDIEAQEVADLCGISLEQYEKMERGESELSVANLQKIAREYKVDFLTRSGQGLSVQRRKAYHYESLASGFRGRKAEPFIVTVEPKPEDAPRESNSHPGQEFNMVFEGQLELTIGKKVLTLNVGDSIYFDATQPHGMRALGGQPVKFLAIII